ncbi:MAG: lipopolysaccharide biosynthesis protein [Brevibacterium sp.]
MHSPRSSFAVVTFGNVAVAGAQWYLVWLFAQQSGPIAVGHYSTLIAMMTPVFIATQLGLRNLFVTLQQTVRWRIYLGCRLSTVGLSILIITGLVIFGPAQIHSALAFPLLMIKVSDSIGDLFYARLQKTERLFTFGLILLGVATVSAITVTVVILSTGSVVTALWSAAVVSAAGTVVTIWVASAKPPETPEAIESRTSVREEIRALITAGVPMSLMQGVYSLLSYVPLAVVAWFGSPSDVGRYASAAYLVVFANLVGASIETVVLPAFRTIHDGDGPVVLRRRVKRLCAIALTSLVPFVVLALFIGPWLLSTIYGADFVLSREAVLFLALAALCTLPTYLASANLLVLNRYWATFFVGAVAIGTVLAGGGIAGMAGMSAVEAGCFAVFIGSLTRLLGEFYCSRPRLESSPVTL